MNSEHINCQILNVAFAPCRHRIFFLLGGGEVAVKCCSAIGPAPACAQPIGLSVFVFCPVIGERLCMRLSDWLLRCSRTTQLVAVNVNYANFPSSLYGECWMF